MLLLIIGTIAYSFIISYISNYIYKKNQKSLTFEKNLGILKEIKLHNPYLKDTIYHEVLKNLHNEQLYERKDKSLLFDCLPYSLKNKLIMEMYKPFVENFVFFKENENCDFVVKVVTSLKPLLAFKNDILIQEGDFIKEIFFVKKGVLSLNITIDKLNVENSLKKYLGRNELGGITVSFVPELMKNTTIHNLNDNLYDYFLNKKIDKKLVIKNEINIREIKIIEIRKNEHFGDALMFLNERSPLIVKVKTKISELLILRKMEAIEIYSIYPNIWKRINKKSLYNMEQIKIRIKKELLSFAKKYGSEAEKNVLKSSKSLQRFMTINTLQNTSNDSQNEFTNSKSKNIKKKEKKKKRINKNIEFQIIDKVNENIYSTA
jgi:CRP-like cAMP-binding protein